MTYADMFSKVKGLFMESDVSDISEHLAFQFNITGEVEGIFYAEVKDGVLAVEPYEYFDRDAIFICSAETLFKLAEVRLDPSLAFTTGKRKVEGNIDKALRLKQIIDLSLIHIYVMKLYLGKSAIKKQAAAPAKVSKKAIN